MIGQGVCFCIRTLQAAFGSQLQVQIKTELLSSAEEHHCPHFVSRMRLLAAGLLVVFLIG